MWKNDSNEGDVAIAFGTLVPFVNTGVNLLHILLEIIKEKAI